MATIGVTWTHPALLWGLAAVLIPLLIHLLLRPRPRALRFPALTLMHRALATGQRAQRVRNVLLLALRAAFLAVAALLLAGPTCTTGSTADLSDPRTGVLLLDDSLSMHYRPAYDAAETLLDAARRAAAATVEASRAWPAGSTLLLLGAAENDPQAAPTVDRDALLAALRPPEREPQHTRPLGVALLQAANILHAAPTPRRCLVVFTDLAASAWRDVPAGLLAGLAGLDVRIVAVSDRTRPNFALRTVNGPAQRWPALNPAPIQVTLAAGDVDGACVVTVEEAGQVVARAGPLEMSAGQRRDLTLSVPPGPTGPRGATVRLEPDDLWPFDQVRYVAWEAVARPLVWLLTPPGLDTNADMSVVLIRNLLAPELADPEQQRVTLHFVTPRELEAADQPPAPVLVAVFPGVNIAEAQRAGLLRRVEGGATLLLMPSSTAPDADWPLLRALLAEDLPTLETLATPTALRWAGGFSAPGGAPSELARGTVMRRLRFAGLHDAARAAAEYADGRSAIVFRRLGRGHVVALTTSPDPEWSDLGVRAAGLLTWLHGLVDAAQGPPGAAAMAIVGERLNERFAALPPDGLVQVVDLTNAGAPPRWVRVAGGVPEDGWPTEAAGLYALETAGGRAGCYAVNWPPEESDFTEIERSTLVELLGTNAVTIERGGRAEGRSEEAGIAALLAWFEPRRALGFLVLLLFLGEMLLARRPRAA